MLKSMTIDELLEAKDGEHVQFKEAKNRFSFDEAAKCCCALSNCGGGRLVFGITDKRPRMIVDSRAFDQPERARMSLIDKLKVMNCEMKAAFTAREEQAQQGGMRIYTSESGANLIRTCTELAPNLPQTYTKLETAVKLAPKLNQTCTKLTLVKPKAITH